MTDVVKCKLLLHLLLLLSSVLRLQTRHHLVKRCSATLPASIQRQHVKETHGMVNASLAFAACIGREGIMPDLKCEVLFAICFCFPSLAWLERIFRSWLACDTFGPGLVSLVSLHHALHSRKGDSAGRIVGQTAINTLTLLQALVGASTSHMMHTVGIHAGWHASWHQHGCGLGHPCTCSWHLAPL